MPVQQYRLSHDRELDGWLLQKCGASCSESFFASKEQAFRLLPEAVERGGTVSIHGDDGRVEVTLVIP